MMKNKDLKNEVTLLVAEVKRTHRYSMSRIYGLYNEVFEKNETPQSCASCLIRKVKELELWLDSEPLKEVETPAPIGDSDNQQSAADVPTRKKAPAKTKKTKADTTGKDTLNAK